MAVDAGGVALRDIRCGLVGFEVEIL